MISLEGAVALTPGRLLKPVTLAELEEKLGAEHLARFAGLCERSEAERAAQIAAQRAVKAHTVYKVDGKVIGLHEQGGFTGFASNADGAAGRGVKEEAAARGLSGAALNDFVADRITAALKRKYGAALQVESYGNSATAPTSGEIRDLMFGRSTATSAATTNATAAATTQVQLDTLTYAQLRRAGRD